MCTDHVSELLRGHGGQAEGHRHPHLVRLLLLLTDIATRGAHNPGQTKSYLSFRIYFMKLLKLKLSICYVMLHLCLKKRRNALLFGFHILLAYRRALYSRYIHVTDNVLVGFSQVYALDGQ